jgi:hypothetical protein
MGNGATRYPDPVCGVLSDDSEFDPHDRREWLLAIGRRLRADYDALKEPVPERLAALVKQLENGNRSC